MYISRGPGFEFRPLHRKTWLQRAYHCAPARGCHSSISQLFPEDFAPKFWSAANALRPSWKYISRGPGFEFRPLHRKTWLQRAYHCAPARGCHSSISQLFPEDFAPKFWSAANALRPSWKYISRGPGFEFRPLHRKTWLQRAYHCAPARGCHSSISQLFPEDFAPKFWSAANALRPSWKYISRGPGFEFRPLHRKTWLQRAYHCAPARGCHSSISQLFPEDFAPKFWSAANALRPSWKYISRGPGFEFRPLHRKTWLQRAYHCAPARGCHSSISQLFPEDFAPKFWSAANALRPSWKYISRGPGFEFRPLHRKRWLQQAYHCAPARRCHSSLPQLFPEDFAPKFWSAANALRPSWKYISRGPGFEFRPLHRK